jgi:hypothetical protein
MRSLLRPLDEWLWRYLVSCRKFVCRRADHHFQPSSLTFILHPGHFYNNKQQQLLLCMDVFTAPWKPWPTHQQQHCLAIAAGLIVWVVTMYVGFGRATCAEGGGHFSTAAVAFLAAVVRIVCDDEEQPPAEAIQFDDGVYSTIQRFVQYLLILFICLLLWSSVNAMIGVEWIGGAKPRNRRPMSLHHLLLI